MTVEIDPNLVTTSLKILSMVEGSVRSCEKERKNARVLSALSLRLVVRLALGQPPSSSASSFCSPARIKEVWTHPDPMRQPLIHADQLWSLLPGDSRDVEARGEEGGLDGLGGAVAVAEEEEGAGESDPGLT